MNNNQISNLDITSEELVNYLTVTYSILKEAQSSLDIDRLKYIINILKKDDNKIYKKVKKKSIRKNENYELISQLIVKQRNEVPIDKNEAEILNNYWKDKPYFDMLINRKYAEIFTYINENQNSILTNDLLIIQLFLTGNEIKIRKKADILIKINTYLNQILYYNNMDKRYDKEKQL